MSETILQQVVEKSLSQPEVSDLLERISDYRGDFLKGLAKLKAGPTKYIKFFLNEPIDAPTKAILHTTSWIAEGHRKGSADEGEYLNEEWSKIGIVEVSNFDLETVKNAISQYESDTRGAKGNVDRTRVGIVDLSNPEQNKIKLGELNLGSNTLTTAGFDKRSI